MAQSATRNLIMVNRPGWQAIDDFHAIAERIRQRAPDIEVFVVNDNLANSVSARRAAHRPTLVFSPSALKRFKPRRGVLRCGGYMAKPVQLARLRAGGVPVPHSEVLTPGLRPDPASFGPLVILKPLARGFSSAGRAVKVMRTANVRFIPPHDYPAGHPGRLASMLVQQFIDTGEQPTYHRVLTLFGKPLFAQRKWLDEKRPPLDSNDETLETATFAGNGGPRSRQAVSDPELLELARMAYEAVPDAPLQGCDIVRCVHTGKLYVLELNPGGNTWHFSSSIGGPAREGVGGVQNLIDQFGAWDQAAGVLIERTRADAI